jgi:diguanylate cyclase (GGDEF)-like protein
VHDFFEANSQRHRFTDDEIEAFHHAGRREIFRKGEQILERGASGDSMFLVLEGSVSVVMESGITPVGMGPGTYFGELSFINPEHRRSTTIVARTDCALMILDQESADSLFTTHPRALFTLLRRACAFLLDKEEELIGNLTRKNRELEQSLDFLRRTKEELDYQELLAQTDELTGLYNRRCLMDQLAKSMKRADESRCGLALVMVDLDNFKPINDSLGHAAGDEVLRRVSEIMRHGVRQSDLPCRLGGDEFAIVLPEVKNHIARKRARTILRQIERMPQVSADVVVTVSMGGTMFQSGETAEELVARADALLYKAKENGRNQLCWS